jgi:hypothetical protein
MTEYNTPSPKPQQENLTLIEDVEIAILNMRDLAGALRRVGLDAAAEELLHIADSLVGSAYFASLKAKEAR